MLISLSFTTLRRKNRPHLPYPGHGQVKAYTESESACEYRRYKDRVTLEDVVDGRCLQQSGDGPLRQY